MMMNTSSSSSPTASQKHRRNRRELNFADRIKVITARNSGKSMRHLAAEFGCGKTQILNILGQRETYLREWEEKAASNPHFRSRKRRVRRTSNEETNRLVWQWYCSLTEQGFRVTGPALQNEARSIAKSLGISNFVASNGWLESFRRVHNIDRQSKCKAFDLPTDVYNNSPDGNNTKKADGASPIDDLLQDNNSLNTHNHAGLREGTNGSENPIDLEDENDRDDATSASIKTFSSSESITSSATYLDHQPDATPLLPVLVPSDYSIVHEDDCNKFSGRPYREQTAVIHRPVALRPPTSAIQHQKRSILNTNEQSTIDSNVGQDCVNHQQQQRRETVLVSTRSAIAAAVAVFADNASNEEEASYLSPIDLTIKSSTNNNRETRRYSGSYNSLVAMAKSEGLSFFQYSDDRGESWMEIRPPSATMIRVPFYGYRTHLLRLIVNCHLDYWLEALGQCVHSGSFLSLTSGGVDVSGVQAVFNLLAGDATLCQGRDSVHPSSASEETFLFTLPDRRYRSYNCSRLVDGRTKQTQCSACSTSFAPLLNSSAAGTQLKAS